MIDALIKFLLAIINALLDRQGKPRIIYYVGENKDINDDIADDINNWLRTENSEASRYTDVDNGKQGQS